MVTCKIVSPVQDKILLKSQGRFVLPITWLYVMAFHKQIEVSDALLFKSNFTDEMLADLLLDFKTMGRQAFCNSQFHNMICMYNDWNVDKQWYGLKAEKPMSTVYVEYKGNQQFLRAVLIDPNTQDIPGQALLDYSNPQIARVNLEYAKVLSNFSKNVTFKGLPACQKTILKS